MVLRINSQGLAVQETTSLGWQKTYAELSVDAEQATEGPTKIDKGGIRAHARSRIETTITTFRI